jgi:hypothetical protein
MWVRAQDEEDKIVRVDGFREIYVRPMDGSLWSVIAADRENHLVVGKYPTRNEAEFALQKIVEGLKRGDAFLELR